MLAGLAMIDHHIEGIKIARIYTVPFQQCCGKVALQ